jgi:hypothetical protein
MFIPDPGSEFSIPDPECKDSGSGIHIKVFKYFNPKKIPDPEVKKAPDPGAASLHVRLLRKIKSFPAPVPVIRLSRKNFILDQCRNTSRDQQKNKCQHGGKKGAVGFRVR